jgi:hypothetical protein
MSHMKKKKFGTISINGPHNLFILNYSFCYYEICISLRGVKSHTHISTNKLQIGGVGWLKKPFSYVK